jgi:hypothetical protein
MNIPIARTYKDSKREEEKGNFLRQIGIFTWKEISDSLEKLSYPTSLWKIGEDVCELYEIPSDQKEKILNEVYILSADYYIDVTKNWESFDGEEEFLATDFKIIWFNGCNYIVSPFFAETGTMADDCIEK